MFLHRLVSRKHQAVERELAGRFPAAHVAGGEFRESLRTVAAGRPALFLMQPDDFGGALQMPRAVLAFVGAGHRRHAQFEQLFPRLEVQHPVVGDGVQVRLDDARNPVAFGQHKLSVAVRVERLFLFAQAFEGQRFGGRHAVVDMPVQRQLVAFRQGFDDRSRQDIAVAIVQIQLVAHAWVPCERPVIPACAIAGVAVNDASETRTRPYFSSSGWSNVPPFSPSTRFIFGWS